MELLPCWKFAVPFYLFFVSKKDNLRDIDLRDATRSLDPIPFSVSWHPLEVLFNYRQAISLVNISPAFYTLHL